MLNETEKFCKFFINKAFFVGSVIEWLKRCACDRHGLGSKSTRAILLCPREKHFTPLFFACWSWQRVLNFSHIFIKLKNKKKTHFNRKAISWHLRKQIGVIAYALSISPPTLSCESAG